MSPHITTNVTVRNAVSVTLRDIQNSIRTYRRFGNTTISTSFGIGGR
jgi:hypothetical protein